MTKTIFTVFSETWCSFPNNI